MGNVALLDALDENDGLADAVEDNVSRGDIDDRGDGLLTEE